nr:flavodoxin [Lachnoclostridium phocaeense]
MKKQIVTILMTSALALGITACGAGTAEDQASGENQTDTGAATGSSNILIAYFSVPEDVDTEGIDADAGASIVVDDGQVKGNLEYTAGVIQQTTGGDLLRIETVDQYDTILLGYPIWWGEAAWPVNQFVKNNDFTGKTVIPFATSASSGFGESGQLLADMAGTGDWQEGMRFGSSPDEAAVQEWIDGLGLYSVKTE